MAHEGSPFPQSSSDIRGGNEPGRAAAVQSQSPGPQASPQAQGPGGLGAPVSVGDKLADVAMQIIQNGGTTEDGAAVGQFLSQLQEAMPQVVQQQNSFPVPPAQGQGQPAQQPPQIPAFQQESSPVAPAGFPLPAR